MTRMVELEEAGVGSLWVNPEHVRSVGESGEGRTVVEFGNGDQKIVMGQPQEIASLLERDDD